MVNPQDSVGILTDKMGRMVCSNCGAELDIAEFTLFERILCPSCESEQVVPGKLGNFLLLDQLGAGGMGAVYLAQDQSLRRRVALKVMRQEYGQNPKFNESFMREAQATAKLNDLNVVQIYSFGQEKGQPYIVMELVDGGRLDKMMEGGRRLDELLVLETAMGVASGLSKAHEGGIVHGDIKPANILYDKENRPKVVDFGLAKFMEESTPAGEIWGTPFYIAPEKIKKKKEDERSDQYCLGATLWHALAGRPPFDGKTAKDVVLARLDTPAENLHDLDPEISQETAGIIARMMHRKPSLRYPTYKSLQADLRTAIKHVTARREAAGAAAAAAKKPPGRLIMVLVSLGLIGALAAAAAFLLKPWLDEKKKARERERMLILINQGGTSENPPVKRTSRTDDDPFTRVEQRKLAAVGQEYAAGNTLQGDISLAEMLSTTKKYAPENHAALQWVPLIQGITATLMNQPQLAKDYLGPIKEAVIKYDGESEPAENPRVLAQVLLGELGGEALADKTKGAAPWYVELAGFLEGLKQVQAGKVEGALAAVAGYADQQQREPEWAYALQPIAKSLRKQAEEIRALIPADGTNPDLGKIEAYFGTCFPVWKTTLDPYLKKAAAADAAEIAARKEAERLEAERQKAEALKLAAVKAKALEAAQQAERTRVDEAVAAANEKAANKDFGAALQELETLAGTLQHEASKKALEPARQRMQRKADTKAFLVNTINTSPYKGPPILGGLPVKAEESWLGIKLPNKNAKVPWDKLPEVEFAKLGSYCIEVGSKDPKEQAEKSIGMALFFYDHGNRKIAEKFVEKAGVYNPKAQETIKGLMPEL